MTQKTALQSIISHIGETAEIFAPIRINRLENEGISVQLLSGRNESEYLSGGALQTMPLLFLAKSAVQTAPLDALENIQNALKTLPDGIERIELISSPALVEGSDNSYIYEMQITAAFYKERN